MKNDRLLSDIAQERIARLMDLAKARTIKIGSTDALAKRYIRIAKDIKDHYRIRQSNEIKQIVCKGCGSVVVPGMNATVRIAGHNNYRVIMCAQCGTEKHLFLR